MPRAIARGILLHIYGAIMGADFVILLLVVSISLSNNWLIFNLFPTISVCVTTYTSPGGWHLACSRKPCIFKTCGIFLIKMGQKWGNHRILTPDTISLSRSFNFLVTWKYTSLVTLLSSCPRRLEITSKGTPCSAKRDV